MTSSKWWCNTHCNTHCNTQKVLAMTSSKWWFAKVLQVTHGQPPPPHTHTHTQMHATHTHTHMHNCTHAHICRFECKYRSICTNAHVRTLADASVDTEYNTSIVCAFVDEDFLVCVSVSEDSQKDFSFF